MKEQVLPIHLLDYVKAAFPVVAVPTVEEDRLIKDVLTHRDAAGLTAYGISATGGFARYRIEATRLVSQEVNKKSGFQEAIEKAASTEDNLLFVRDLQHLIANAPIYRAIKDQMPALKAKGSMVILIAPDWAKLPPELRHDIPVLDYALPNRDQLREALEVVLSATRKSVKQAEKDACLDAAAGLTLTEAENAFALAFIHSGTMIPRRIEQEKVRMIRDSGLLDIYPAESMDSLGGLLGLKEYFLREVLPSKDDPLLRVRGILLVGVSGCGKSRAAKVAGGLLGRPVAHMNIAALKASFVGESESRMRQALRLLEAIAPCVAWIDELEKGVGGYRGSGATDSGVTSGMLGIYLTWLQEHRSDVLTIATVNSYEALPAEITRAGRFDERFFVDLPNEDERIDIARIHLAGYGCDVKHAQHIAETTEGYTGAEIEQGIKSAARRSVRKLTTPLIDACFSQVKPISVVRGEEINRMRQWAKDCLRMANTPEEFADDQRRIRKLRALETELEGEVQTNE